MKLVLDASMALAWFFERSDTAQADCAQSALLAVGEADVYVPALWHIEIANALLVGERRGVVSTAQVLDYLSRLSRLPIITDDTPSTSRRDLIMALAREHNLSAYDATYLDLALRSNATLATFDKQLARALNDAGGKLFEAYSQLEKC